MRLSNKIKGALGALSVATIGFLGGGMYGSHSDKQANEKQKTELIKQEDAKSKIKIKIKTKEVVDNPIRTVSYRTDTLSKSTSTLLYYFGGKITRNFVEGNNLYSIQLPYFAHEDWHYHNDKIGYRWKYKLSPQEYYKLCMHDEISANLAAILTARYEYLSAKNKDAVIKKYMPTYMRFYFKEILHKRIKPESSNPRDVEKERKFLANETPKMWMKLYAPVYAARTARMVKRYIKRVGIVEDSKRGYDFIKKHMYYIGGVEFDAYMDKDIDYHDDMVSISEEMRKVKTLKEGYKDILKDVDANYKLLDEVHVLYGAEAFQHMFVAGKLKYKLRGLDKKTLEAYPQIVTSCYNNILGQMRNDKTFNEFMENIKSDGVLTGHFVVDEDKYKEVVRKMYKFKDVDLTKVIENFDVYNVPQKEKYLYELDNNRLQFSYPFLLKNDYAVNALNAINISSRVKQDKFATNESGNADHEGEKAKLQNVRDVAPKKRISNVQYIDIPNFYDPILTKNTGVQNKAIYQMMQDFENIPEEMKSCDTKKQQEFLKAYKKGKSQSR